MIIHSALPAFQSSPEGATLLASASCVGLVAVEGSGSVFRSDDMAKCVKMWEVTEVAEESKFGRNWLAGARYQRKGIAARSDHRQAAV